MTIRRAAAATLCLSLTLLVLSLAVLSGGRDDAPAAPPDPFGPAGPDELAPFLHLQWVRELPPLQPAWPDQPLLQFDAAYPLAARGRTLFLASSRDDAVVAYDAETGAAKWRFFAEGPVRFAPALWGDHVFFASDDGFLYCLKAESGALQWKFRGGPSDRKILGNQRLISTWPARGAPVVAEEADGRGVVYFAAGIWPFMGVFLHALDARTGEVVWTSDGDGSIYMKQPHQVDAFGGVAPQGTLAVVGDRLLVPCGRSVPACYDRRNGKLLHFRLADDSKLCGGAEVTGRPGYFVNGGSAFDLATGSFLGPVGEHVAATPDVLYGCFGSEIRAYDVRKAAAFEQAIDRKGQAVVQPAWKPTPFASTIVPRVEALTRSGARLYAGAAGQVFAVDLPLQAGKAPLAWQAPVAGRPVQLLAAGGRLFVSTREGRVYCFGPDRVEPRTFPLSPIPDYPEDEWTEKAHDLLARAGVRDGYCVVWGVGSGRLITELVRQSNLQVVAVEPDARKADDFRADMAAARFLGERVAVITAAPAAAELPPYLAELMTAEDLDALGAAPDRDVLFHKVFETLRPYGGVACLPVPADEQRAFADMLADADLVNAKIRATGDWVLLSREGPLPGAADWTHEHADAANTRVSRDRIVKAPLGLLWFGGPSHDGILPRHGHGPQPQVVDGRLFIEGVDFLRAVDVYTGRLLWEAPLPGLGLAYDNLAHQPGANAGGTNYVSTPEGLYIAYGTSCVRLDPASGRRLGSFALPPFPGEKAPPVWDWLTVGDDCVIGGANPGSADRRGRPAPVSASKRLTVLDRRSGGVRWSLTAQTGFRHNAVCLGGGRLYAVDRPSSDQLDWLKRRGDSPTAKGRLVAADLRTGKEAWATADGVFGTWLSYSDKYDILIEAGRNARDTLSDEPRGMRAFAAGRGKLMWSQPGYGGPAMIHGDVVLRDGGGCDVRTGAPTMRADPLTGQPAEWVWSRNYGCNTPAASENLLTFRSGAAGYFDLCNDGGTGNFGGFRSSCTNNLIVADGVLNAPDYTRNCTCSYQNQCSLAMVPMPEAEMWTFYTPQTVNGVIRRIGVKLGAPGCRKADDGTLWVDFPPVGGPAPRPAVTVTPPDPDWFRRHSSQVEGDGPAWVIASGAKGLRSLRLALAREPVPDHTYTVRLYFVEPDHLPPGRRVFDVLLQGDQVVSALDVVEEAGGPNRGVVKEVKGVRAGRELTVTLTPVDPTMEPPVLCGVEVAAEGW